MNNSSKDMKRTGGESVEKEVQKLMQKKNINSKTLSSEMEKLRIRFNDDDLVNEIQKVFLEKHNNIVKKAKKFAELIRRKYGSTQYPFNHLLEKARANKKKHYLSDSEFEEFRRIFEEELVGIKSNEIIPPSNNMNKVLGSIYVGYGSSSMKLNDTDYKHMQEILKVNASTKSLHQQVLLQSLQYSDCDYEAVTGKYVRHSAKGGPGDHVHPVVVAMFLPKIPIFEQHFVRSNLSSIVKARYNNEPLSTRADYELFYALSRDPNDVVCDNRSSVLDLLNRVQIQTQLWNSVLSLRNGQYYNTSFRDFVTAVDMCKFNKYDNPDLIYGRYDGTIMKRLLSSFSFRPTLVATNPVVNAVVLNPYLQTVRPTVTTVPMINLRLPPNLDPNNPIAVNLLDSLNQSQFMLNNGVITSRQTSIIYSSGVLLFFVDRRSNVYKVDDLQPFNVNKMPLAVAGFERLNTTPVGFDTIFNIRDDEYRLRSVVCAEVNQIVPGQNNVVVGSSALVLCHAGSNIAGLQLAQTTCLKYDPYSVIQPVLGNAPGTLAPNESPIVEIDVTPNLGGNENFTTLATERGIIFVYELCRDETAGEILF